MTDENKKVKIRPKSLFTFKLPKPKIVFGSVTSTIQEHEHSSVPDEFREFEKMYENISQQKFIQTDEVMENSLKDDEVVARKGPTVQKGLKDEVILQEMRSLVSPGDPWNIYSCVRIVLS